MNEPTVTSFNSCSKTTSPGLFGAKNGFNDIKQTRKTTKPDVPVRNPVRAAPIDADVPFQSSVLIISPVSADAQNKEMGHTRDSILRLPNQTPLSRLSALSCPNLHKEVANIWEDGLQSSYESSAWSTQAFRERKTIKI